MGVAYFITTDGGTHDFAALVDGKGLAKFSRHLERLARQLGVSPLDEFLYVSQDMVDHYLGDSDPDEEADLASAQEGPWFTPDQGLATTSALIAHLSANPAAGFDTEWALADLRSLSEALQLVQTKGLKWRLGIDI